MIFVQQPKPYNLVGEQIMVAGIAGGAFEASYSCRITEGHDEVEEPFMAGNGMGGHGQFQLTMDCSSASFKLPNLFVEVFHYSAKNGEELDKVIVPVVSGSILLPNYTGYTGYIYETVQPGDTLWGLAKHFYGDGKKYHIIVAANRSIADGIITVGDKLRIPQA